MFGHQKPLTTNTQAGARCLVEDFAQGADRHLPMGGQRRVVNHTGWEIYHLT
jgi:hypothetical protein